MQYCSLFYFISLISLFFPPEQGKKNSVLRECYFGSQRHCKLTRLFPACSYTFRLAAHNDMGTRYCSLLLNIHTHMLDYTNTCKRVKHVFTQLLINEMSSKTEVKACFVLQYIHAANLNLVLYVCLFFVCIFSPFLPHFCYYVGVNQACTG